MPKSDSGILAPAAELRSYIQRFDAGNQKIFRSVRTALRKRLPVANELAYDYGSHIVIAYAPTERGIEAALAIALRANGVQLYLNQGKKLPDPQKLLQGSGQTRFVWLDSARKLGHPDIEALIEAAIRAAAVPYPAKGKGTVIIRPTAARKRQRPKSRK